LELNLRRVRAGTSKEAVRYGAPIAARQFQKSESGPEAEVEKPEAHVSLVAEDALEGSAPRLKVEKRFADVEDDQRTCNKDRHR